LRLVWRRIASAGAEEALKQEVLDQFEALAPADKMKWVKGSRYWRLAPQGDRENRTVKR
jgi:hypothetical protein